MIYEKKVENLHLRNRMADDLETWLSIGDLGPTKFVQMMTFASPLLIFKVKFGCLGVGIGKKQNSGFLDRFLICPLK